MLLGLFSQLLSIEDTKDSYAGLILGYRIQCFLEMAVATKSVLRSQSSKKLQTN